LSSERFFSRFAVGPCGWEVVEGCSEGLRESLVRGWAALGGISDLGTAVERGKEELFFAVST
jgi:hypothetical protein